MIDNSLKKTMLNEFINYYSSQYFHRRNAPGNRWYLTLFFLLKKGNQLQISINFLI